MSRTLPGMAAALRSLRMRLLDAAGAHGHWEGRLSSSALATAVAVAALGRLDGDRPAAAAAAGSGWLASHVNADGGWGDTPASRSNLSTTLLAWSALGLVPPPEGRREVESGARAWLEQRLPALEPTELAGAVLEAYGADRSFSVPILSMAALCGRLDGRWSEIPQLPHELAALPRRLFRWARLPVVSYAVPALVAMGMLRHHHAPSRLLPLRLLRNRLEARLVRVLEQLQPASGGYLEAVPLTAFVVMALAACGHPRHRVVRAGCRFLLSGQRSDGSWPIDSNLATWVSTRAVEALAPAVESSAELDVTLPNTQRRQLVDWLLAQQFSRRHPFTAAAPGAWGWSDAAGAVPDADDTAGALLALWRLGHRDLRVHAAARAGVHWLAELQNSDGGMPTFCRGWGRLPFDRSCADLTAHALRAVAAWRDELDPVMVPRIDRVITRGLAYLAANQDAQGWWRPLWFGNQWSPAEANPVYGTALVLEALADVHLAWRPGVAELRTRGESWLTAAQNSDGGWGWSAAGGSTVEESGLALAALALRAPVQVVERGAAWLLQRVANDELAPQPIGLYFARLWYAEELYPLCFATRALNRAARRLATSEVGVRRSLAGPARPPRRTAAVAFGGGC